MYAKGNRLPGWDDDDSSQNGEIMISSVKTITSAVSLVETSYGGAAHKSAPFQTKDDFQSEQSSNSETPHQTQTDRCWFATACKFLNWMFILQQPHCIPK